MIIHRFDTQAGIYHTQVNALATELHAHPAAELLIARHGTFNLITATGILEGLTHALLLPNSMHGLYLQNAEVEVWLIEHRDTQVLTLAKSFPKNSAQGIHTRITSVDEVFLQQVHNLVQSPSEQEAYPMPVQQAITWMQQPEANYFELMDALTSLCHLSESRLSHVFKKAMGVSIKRYFVWTRIKGAIAHHLEYGVTLTDALFQFGFYDQPHFIKTYKSLIGLSPAKVYNSRNLQSKPTNAP